MSSKLSFEEQLVRLQQISEQLESDEIKIDDAIKLYEEGIKLAKKCREKIKKAELKIINLKEEMENDSEEFNF